MGLAATLPELSECTLCINQFQARTSHPRESPGVFAKDPNPASVVCKNLNSPEGRAFAQTSIKSVQSALSDLLTTSATHGTFSRPSTKRGLILIGLELNTNARESFEHC